MFDFLGGSEIALVFVLIIILFNARDLLKVVKFLKKTYDWAQDYYYKLKAEIMYDPPTEDELKAQKETEEFYKKYGEGYNPYEHPPAGEKSPYPTDDDPGTDNQDTKAPEREDQNIKKPKDQDQ